MFVQQINIIIDQKKLVPNLVPNVVSNYNYLSIYMNDNNPIIPNSLQISKKIKMYKSLQNVFTGYRALSSLNYENNINVIFFDEQTKEEKKCFQINKLDEENINSNLSTNYYNTSFQLNYKLVETFDDSSQKYVYDLILVE